MGGSNGARLGNAAALVRVASSFPPHRDSPAEPDSVGRQRRLLVELFRLIGEQVNGSGNGRGNEVVDVEKAAGAVAPVPSELSPRLRQTLRHLLEGDGEKQIAAKLGVSRHTVHVYVKSLYRRFDVCSRSELLAHFIRTRPGD